MITATFIRHAESETNAGGRSNTAPSIPLSARGREDARRAARDHAGPAPDLVVVSPYRRAGETAAPFLARFAGARAERWPVHEFTFLKEDRYRDTTIAERRPATEAYWRRADPEWVDGPGAESFAAFLARIGAALERLRAVPEETVLVFGHETAIKAAMWLCENRPATVTPETMRAFREFALSFSIPNLGTWTLPADAGG